LKHQQHACKHHMFAPVHPYAPINQRFPLLPKTNKFSRFLKSERSARCAMHAVSPCIQAHAAL